MPDAHIFPHSNVHLSRPWGPSVPGSPAPVRCPRPSTELCQQIHPSRPFLSIQVEAEEGRAGVMQGTGHFQRGQSEETPTALPGKFHDHS